MKSQSALAWTGTIVLGVIGAAAGIWFMPLLGAPTAASARIAPPSQAEALVSKLTASRPLAGLDQTPVSCERTPNAEPWNHRCLYRSGEAELLISWSGRSGRVTGLAITKAVARGSRPFAWADLATTTRLLCSDIDQKQAAALAREAPEKLLRTDWRRSNGERAKPAMEGAMRSLTVRHSDECVFELSEQTDGNAIQARMAARAFQPE